MLKRVNQARTFRHIAAALVLLACPAIVRAGGGAHVVDDASVERPGVCYADSWISLTQVGGGLLNLSPGCTPKVLPNLEVGGTFEHSWNDDVLTTAGPALKLNLSPLESGLGVALSASAAWDLASGSFDTVSIVAPVSIPVSERLLLNLNGGWAYGALAEVRHSAFYGAQAEFELKPHLSLMGEMFGHHPGRIGNQAGLRMSSASERFDLDLLVGRYVDGESPRSFTVGLTFRR